MTMARRFIWLMGLWLFPASALAGAWARPLGGVYLRGGAGFFFGQQSFSLASLPNARFRSYAGEFYGEVGISHGLEIDTSLRYVKNGNVFEQPVDGHTKVANSGVEDLELYLKWAPINATNALSLVGGVRLSLYDPLPVAELNAGKPRIGQGGHDVLFGVWFGHSFYPASVWFTGDITGRYRIGSNSGGLRIRGELGGRIVGPLQLAGTVEFQPNFGNTTFDNTRAVPTPVPDVFGLGLKLFANFYRGLGVNADFSWYPTFGNSGPGVRFGISLTYEFDPRARKKKSAPAVKPAS